MRCGDLAWPAEAIFEFDPRVYRLTAMSHLAPGALLFSLLLISTPLSAQEKTIDVTLIRWPYT